MIKELIRFIKKLRKQQHEVILLIDANESITDSNSLIGKLLSQTQICDPIFKQHRSKNQPNTHIKGSKRIDYIFCTQHISQYISSSNILPFDFVTTTDHRALFIDIYLNKYTLKTQTKSIKIRKQEDYNQHSPMVSNNTNITFLSMLKTIKYTKEYLSFKRN